ncbi:hypothetical protein [Candidatus Uabimicrobium sp. HlEnr_7]|uniref:hypothetical protein n=1 Tax=Candidatus Uabimicrobium helgolandensis TaxID=3095367 RepID=UPI00355844E0
MNVQDFLTLLRKVKKLTNGWSACCPSHGDKVRSLSVDEGKDGIILFKCHAGCEAQDILGSISLTWKDIFPQTSAKNKNNITVEKLAFDKGVTEEFLRSVGVEENGSALRISYFLENGSLASRQRRRRALSAKRGSSWEKGRGKPVLYGLWKLKETRKKKWITFVEGESDCWSMWQHSLPALGFPGADMASKLGSTHIRSLKKIYVIKEPDKGGETFLKGVRKRLQQLNYKENLFVIEMSEFKDINQMAQKSFDFKKDFAKLKKAAKPVSLTEGEIVVDYGNLIPELPAPKNKTVLQLMISSAANVKENFCILAPQGAGKSYANSHVAVSELKKGRSVILFSRSHDELNQLGKSISVLLEQQKLPLYHLYHLKRGNEKSDLTTGIVPDVRPIIVIAPHAYLKFKGDTPYHYVIVDMFFNKQFGENPLVLVDEVGSLLESCFVSKSLGSRESLKKMFGQELIIRNKLCPLFTSSGNCTNCTGKMFLVLRRGSGGMLEYKPLSQRYQDDRIREEKVELKHVRWDAVCHDNTMSVYPISSPKNNEERTWSTGSKDDLQKEMCLQNWYDDIIARTLEPSLVFFYPYNRETQENLGRPLDDKELKTKRKDILPPRQVCGVPVFQGWDIAVLKKINQNAQIGITGPGASETERYILKQVLGLNKSNFHIAEKPFFQFKKVLILSLESDLPSKKSSLQDFFQQITSQTKVLAFYPTYFEAKTAEKKISSEVRTMYYDGEQKVSNAPIKGTSIEFDLCITCIHGPLGQGINLGQFKMAVVSTNNERPKCLFASRPHVKTIREHILDDVAEKSRQAALRILRLDVNEKIDEPRVILFYGRNATEVSHRVQTELIKVGHKIKMIDANENISYSQEIASKWLAGKSIAKLEKIGEVSYQSQKDIKKLQDEISRYVESTTEEVTWRKILRYSKCIRRMNPQSKEVAKTWYESNFKIEKKPKTNILLTQARSYLNKNPESNWRDICRKFNLSRKNKQQMQLIKKKLGL